MIEKKESEGEANHKPVVFDKAAEPVTTQALETPETDLVADK